MKRILIGTVAVIMALPCYADTTPSPSTVTSVNYVQDQISTKQLKIPAANTAGVGAGESVITYTSGGNGVIGERGLFTGGTYDASSDADKLITASALNAAFTLPTTDTTTLECANPGTCTLWTIVDQTAYGSSGGGSGGGGNTVDPTAMLQALVNTNGTGFCLKLLSGNDESNDGCTTPPSTYGGWGAMFEYEGNNVQISGISACSSLDEGLTYGQVASNQSQIDADYATSGGGATASSNPNGGNCYCKMTGPAESRWVFRASRSSSSVCADRCAADCGDRVRRYSDFRSEMFGSVQQ